MRRDDLIQRREEALRGRDCGDLQDGRLVVIRGRLTVEFNLPHSGLRREDLEAIRMAQRPPHRAGREDDEASLDGLGHGETR